MAVNGINELLRRFDSLPFEIQEDVKDAIEETTLKIQRQAIQNAPVAGQPLETTYGQQRSNTGINQYIGADFENNGLTGRVFIEQAATELAIYIEFGTGVSAANYVPTLPQEFQEVAKRYYINGKGTLIKAPFLLPAYFQYSPEAVKKITTALKSLKL